MNHVRTTDPALRNQQWDRLRAVSFAFAIEAELINKLRSYLAATKAYQKHEWHRPHPDTSLLRDLAKAIKQGQERLTLATHALSSFQEELELLKTVLVDDYGDDCI